MRKAQRQAINNQKPKNKKPITHYFILCFVIVVCFLVFWEEFQSHLGPEEYRVILTEDGNRRGQPGGAGVVGQRGPNHPVSSSYSLFAVCTRHA